ncbi:MAG TPA: DUF2971 domain-containing protein [Polyangiaceae bacterium]|nr:DUF2971 domain-containing protein [Polyangiaceae bacterium]
MWHSEFYRLLRSDDPKDTVTAYALKERHLPSRIFKYRTFNAYALENLRQSRLWMSPPADFNDPFDSSISVDLEPSLLAELTKTADSPEIVSEHDIIARAAQLTRELSTDLSGSHQNALKVCSFTTSSASLVMWAHYADYHRGFCLEYDVATLSANHRRLLFPVSYADDRFSLTEHFMQFSAPGATHDPNSPFAQHLPALAAVRKSPHWEYESEWRILVVDGNRPGGRLLPMPTPVGLYAGARIHADALTVLRSIASERSIPCFQMKLSSTHFALEPAKL